MSKKKIGIVGVVTLSGILLGGCAHDVPQLTKIPNFSNDTIVMAADLAGESYCGDNNVQTCYSELKNFNYNGVNYTLSVFRNKINLSTLQDSSGQSGVSSSYKNAPNQVKALSQSVLKDGNLVPDENGSQSSKKLTFTVSGNAQALVLSNSDTSLPVIIAVRGTDNIANIVEDLGISTVPFLGNNNALVDDGMNKYFEALLAATNVKENKQTLSGVIDSYAKDGRKFIIVGHSLGASAAVLLSAYLITAEHVDKNNITMINFAEPFPGSESFSKTYASQFNLQQYIWFENYTPDGVFSDPVVFAVNLIGNHSFGTKYEISDLSNVPCDTDVCKILALHSMSNYKDYMLNHFNTDNA